MAIIGLGHTIGKNSQGENAQRVLIDNQPIEVKIGNKGDVKHLFNQQNAVASNSEVLLNSYIVPIGKGFELTKINFSGENLAKYTLKFNDNTIDIKRTWWTKFNDYFDLIELSMSEGDKIEIFVENKGNSFSDFNATIIGGEYDA